MATGFEPHESAVGVSASTIPRATLLETLGATLYFRDHTLEIVQGLYDRHGPVVEQRMAFMPPLVSLFGPDANRFVLVDRDDVLSAKRAWDYIMGRIFPNGLLLRDGADHRQHRRIMQPAFHQQALREYVDRMNPIIAAALDGWADAPQPLLAYAAFKRLTLDLACRIFLGVELGSDTERLNAAFEATVGASMSVVRLPIPGLEFDRGLRGRAHMLDFFGSLLPAKRVGDGADMFSRLCHAEGEDGGRYADAEVLDHLVFLMMAAHDTTTSTLTSLVYELARHPEWQDRVRDECRAFDADALGFDDLNQLDATLRVVHETLRRYPPLSTIPRIAVRDCTFGGYPIREGTMAAIYPLHTHHMPEWWTEPFRFDPDRFSPARREHERHPYLFVPFGGGAHMCIGYRFAETQIKAVVYQLVRRLRWSVPAGYAMPVQQAPISKPKDALPVRFERIG